MMITHLSKVLKKKQLPLFSQREVHLTELLWLDEGLVMFILDCSFCMQQMVWRYWCSSTMASPFQLPCQQKSPAPSLKLSHFSKANQQHPRALYTRVSLIPFTTFSPVIVQWDVPLLLRYLDHLLFLYYPWSAVWNLSYKDVLVGPLRLGRELQDTSNDNGFLLQVQAHSAGKWSTNSGMQHKILSTHTSREQLNVNLDWILHGAVTVDIVYSIHHVHLFWVVSVSECKNKEGESRKRFYLYSYVSKYATESKSARCQFEVFNVSGFGVCAGSVIHNRRRPGSDWYNRQLLRDKVGFRPVKLLLCEVHGDASNYVPVFSNLTFYLLWSSWVHLWKAAGVHLLMRSHVVFRVVMLFFTPKRVGNLDNNKAAWYADDKNCWLFQWSLEILSILSKSTVVWAQLLTDNSVFCLLCCYQQS